MSRMLFLLSLGLILISNSTAARAEGTDAPNPSLTPAAAPAPAIATVHVGTTSGHVTPTLPFGSPPALLMQIRNFTTGDIISNGWESYLWERGRWEFALDPGRKYCYQARSQDAFGTISVWGLAKCATTGTHYYETMPTPVSDQYILFDVALPDLDGDGHLDFFGAVSDDENQPTLFLQSPIGTFTDVTPPQLEELSSSAIFGDWDNDGDSDVYQQRKVFLINNGAPAFTDLSVNLNAVLPVGAWTGKSSQAWVDLDGDGWLELFVTSNTETRAILRKSATTFLLLGGSSLTGFNFIRCIDFTDHDLDGDADLLVVDLNGIHIYENDGAGNLSAIVPGPILTGNTVASWGDLDDDGYPDIAMSNPTRGVEIAMNLQNGTYQKQSGRLLGDALLPEPNGSSSSSAEGLHWADADNDGDLDLFVQRGAETGTVLCRNDGTGVLIAPDDCYPELLCGLRLDTDIITGDLDEDGVLDAFLPGTALAYGQHGIDTANGNWVVLRLIGGRGSNRMAVGASVRLVTGNRVQYRQLWATAQRGSQESPFVHFGLGPATTIDEIVVTWPSGRVDVHRSLPVNERFTIVEGEIITAATPVGSRIALHPPRPNPFGAQTRIAFDLPRAMHVEAVVYDLQGREVRRITDRGWDEGRHTLSWDARDGKGLRVAGGVYFLRLRAHEIELTRRMVLIR